MAREYNVGQLNAQTVTSLTGDIRRALRQNGVNVNFAEVPGFEDIHSGRKETANMDQWCCEQAPVLKPRHRSRKNPGTAHGGQVQAAN